MAQKTILRIIVINTSKFVSEFPEFVYLKKKVIHEDPVIHGEIISEHVPFAGSTV
jgi:hypothetical protein